MNKGAGAPPCATSNLPLDAQPFLLGSYLDFFHEGDVPPWSALGLTALVLATALAQAFPLTNLLALAFQIRAAGDEQGFRTSLQQGAELTSNFCELMQRVIQAPGFLTDQRVDALPNPTICLLRF